jgi:hypothetical protein
MPEDGTHNKQISIADLYPELIEAERQEAEYNLTRYLEIVRGIFERTKNLTE